VTDGQTDGQTDGIAVASTALAMQALRRTVKHSITTGLAYNAEVLINKFILYVFVYVSIL